MIDEQTKTGVRAFVSRQIRSVETSKYLNQTAALRMCNGVNQRSGSRTPDSPTLAIVFIDPWGQKTVLR